MDAWMVWWAEQNPVVAALIGASVFAAMCAAGLFGLVYWLTYSREDKR